MWIRTYSKIYKGLSKETVWKIWTDVNNWPAWHGDLDSCTLKGSFKKGNHFLLKPKGMKAVKIDLLEVEKEKKFTDCTTFFGAIMYDTHELEETNEGLKVTNTLKVTGFLRFLWIKLVAQNIAATVPDEMEALVKLARSYES